MGKTEVTQYKSKCISRCRFMYIRFGVLWIPLSDRIGNLFTQFLICGALVLDEKL